MSTYLLTWNAKKWPWSTAREAIAATGLHGYHDETWSCGRNGRIVAGDRVFLLRQGKAVAPQDGVESSV